jgi:hypothetical protein
MTVTALDLVGRIYRRLAELRSDQDRLEAARLALTGRRPVGRPRRRHAQFPELDAHLKARRDASSV